MYIKFEVSETGKFWYENLLEFRNNYCINSFKDSQFFSHFNLHQSYYDRQLSRVIFEEFEFEISGNVFCARIDVKNRLIVR